MKYMQIYGKWIVMMFIFWGYVIVDQTYDLKKIPVNFPVMAPAVRPEQYKWIHSVSSIKKLKRGKSIVRFKYQTIWGEEQTLQGTFLYSRVVGLPGDRVVVKNGKIIVNGSVVDVGQVSKLAIRDNFAPVIVPRDCIYVINDQRRSSLSYRWDSRMLGPIHFSLVVGVVN